MKLCINCKFCNEKRSFSLAGRIIEFPATCHSPEILSPYDGRGYLDPVVVRKDESLCGMDAKWFEKIEVITQPDDGKIELQSIYPKRNMNILSWFLK